jgi:hypothetical protein
VAACLSFFRFSSPFCLFCLQSAIRQRQLERLLRFFAGIALRANTRSTYGTHHRTFFRLCALIGADYSRPITEQQLCAIIILYSAQHKITTLPGFVSAIQNFAVEHGHSDLPRHTLFQKVKSGLENYYGHTASVERKSALTLNDLCSFRTELNLNRFEDARDWCACLFAFFGLLRISEYANGGLTWSNVRQQTWGIALTVPFSKTSLIPTQIDLIRRDDQLCPLAAYVSYVSLVPAHIRRPDDPFFLAASRSAAPLSEVDFIRRVRSLVRSSLHKDPSSYTGHSFRRGGTTALFLAGVSEATLAVHGRWRSLAYRLYFDSDRSQRFRLMATAQLRLRSSISSFAFSRPQSS